MKNIRVNRKSKIVRLISNTLQISSITISYKLCVDVGNWCTFHEKTQTLFCISGKDTNGRYTDVAYWNSRYAQEKDPFDW